jgi:hypothetical protein
VRHAKAVLSMLTVAAVCTICALGCGNKSAHSPDDGGGAAQLCVIDGGTVGLDDLPSATQLPSGDCAASPMCKLATKDFCPGAESFGPRIDWSCTCDQGQWVCLETGRSKTACVNSHD